MKARNIYIRNNQGVCITKYIYTWESNVRDALHNTPVNALLSEEREFPFLL